MKQRERLLEAAFGAFDGAAGAAGLVAGAIAAGVSPKGLLIVGVGSAVANALSMAGDDRDAGKSWVLAVAMLVGTLVGALVPVLPVVLVPGVGGIALAVATLLVIGAVIAEVRRADRPRWRSYLRTFGWLLGASVAAVVAAVGLGAIG